MIKRFAVVLATPLLLSWLGVAVPAEQAYRAGTPNPLERPPPSNLPTLSSDKDSSADEGPPVPAPPAPDALPEPEVRIIRRGEERIEEYRVNGRLYMVKVIPRWGLPYYFVDNDGDGRLETQFSGIGYNMMIPQWLLFRW